MNSSPDLKQEEYAAKLRRQEMTWRARLDVAESSDRAAVDIGLVAVRSAILINAGALVVLLAFVAQLWGDENTTMRVVLSAMEPFVWGLLAAAVSTGVAYFYQSAVTAQAQHWFAEVSADSDKLRPVKWITPFTVCTRIVMVGLVIASYAVFAWGAWSVMSALKG